MPTGVLDKGREKTTLVFDTWADIGEGAMAVRWDCTLDSDAAGLFAVLAAHLGYLGRSESWVEAEAITDDMALPAGTDAYPHVDGERGDRGWEQVSLVAADTAMDYAQWRERCVAKALADLPLPAGKKKPSKKLEKDRANAIAPYPLDLIDCLQRDTAWWKRHKWSQPPGSKRVLYWRRGDALSVGPPVLVSRRAPAPVTTMLLALTTPSGSRSALPMLERALPQAELLHRTLVGRVGAGARVDCPELTGKDTAGRPLTGHRHAHILPFDLDGDGHLDHVVIHAPMGLGPAAQQAIRGLKGTWTKGGVGELRVALAGQGDLDDLRALPDPLDSGIAAFLGPRLGACEWMTFTPLVLPRYQKVRGANTLSGQVNSELASRGLPAATVEALTWDERSRHLRHAVRVRRYPANPPPVDAGFAIRLVFEQPVFGPLTLGYGSHYGLGLFVAVQSADVG